MEEGVEGDGKIPSTLPGKPSKIPTKDTPSLDPTSSKIVLPTGSDVIVKTQPSDVLVKSVKLDKPPQASTPSLIPTPKPSSPNTGKDSVGVKGILNQPSHLPEIIKQDTGKVDVPPTLPKQSKSKAEHEVRPTAKVHSETPLKGNRAADTKTPPIILSPKIEEQRIRKRRQLYPNILVTNKRTQLRNLRNPRNQHL